MMTGTLRFEVRGRTYVELRQAADEKIREFYDNEAGPTYGVNWQCTMTVLADRVPGYFNAQVEHELMMP